MVLPVFFIEVMAEANNPVFLGILPRKMVGSHPHFDNKTTSSMKVMNGKFQLASFLHIILSIFLHEDYASHRPD